MSILRTFGKIKKRVVAALLVPVCALSFGYCSYDTAMAAAEEAIAAEAFELVPLTWDMFATIMTALGVGTATYWAGKSVADRKITLEEITERLVPEVNWFHQEVADFRDHDIPEYIDGVGGWIKSVVADGKTFLSEDVLSVFTNFAAEQGWLGGETSSVTVPASNPFSVGQLSNIDSSVSASIALISSHAHLSQAQLNRAISIMNHYGNDYFYVGWNFYGAAKNFQVYPISALIGSTVTGVSTNYGMFSANISSAPSVGINFNLSADISDYPISGTSTLFNNCLHALRPNSSADVFSSVSLISSVSGVPVGEKGQVEENDGAIDYPWPVPYPVDVAGSPSFPVTVPDVLAPDVIITQPDISVPVSLPRVTDMPGVFDRDLPTDTTQEETQEGTVDIPQDLPVESPVSPTSSNLFFLPDWIKERFPFCIPFDLKRGADLFRTAGDTPPKWTFTLHYGLHAEKTYTIDVDMSRFNDLMSVFRVGELLLFILGLALVTRSILRS